MPTVSEKLFMDYCIRKNVQCEKIEETHEKTMDFKLVIDDDYVLITEVTEFEINPEEDKKSQEISNSIKNRKCGPIHWDPDDNKRIQQKIKDKHQQLKSYSGVPIVLCFFDQRPWPFSTIDISDIRIALFGELQEYYIRNSEEMTLTYSHSKNINKKIRYDQNLMVSAVGLLNESETEKSFEVIHNPYASIPLDINKCKNFFSTQYKIKLFPDRENELIKILF